MNHAALSHPSTLRSIARAMDNAKKWGVDHARNRKGHAFAAIRYHNGKFQITDNQGASLAYPLRYAAAKQGFKGFYAVLSNHVELQGWAGTIRTKNGKIAKGML